MNIEKIRELYNAAPEKEKPAYSELLLEIKFWRERNKREPNEEEFSKILEETINELYEKIEFQLEMGYQEASFKLAAKIDVLEKLTAPQAGIENEV